MKIIDTNFKHATEVIKHLELARKEKNVRKSKIARRINASQAWVGDVFNLQTPQFLMHLERFIKMCKIMDVCLCELLIGEHKMPMNKVPLQDYIKNQIKMQLLSALKEIDGMD